MGKNSFKTLSLAFLIIMIALLPASSFVAAQSAQQTKTPIKHVIIIFKENRSFDNLFGTYPYGHNEALKNNSIIKKLSIPDGVLNMKVEVPNYPGLGSVLGYTKLAYADSPVQQDPGEGWVDYHGDWDYGRMDGYVAYSGPQSMVYIDYNQIPFYWDYAEEYVLCDNYFTAVMTESLPNFLGLWSGTTVVSNDISPPPYLPLNDTIFYQLSKYNVSWGIFGLYSTEQSPPSSEIGWLENIKDFAGNPAMMSHIYNISVFYQMLKNNSLPAYVFMDDYGIADGISDHPPDNITYSEMWTVNVINAVMNSPEWSSSAIFITWDDEGGFYDHVPPPQINSFGLGLRTACLIISPYAKEDYIDHQVLSHYSLLKFVEWNWNLPYLNEDIAESNLPLDAFNFNQQPRPPIILGPTPNIAGTLGTSHGYIEFENGSSYRLTATQTSQQYPIPLQIPVSQLPYSVPQNYSGNIGFTVSYKNTTPAWVIPAQFYLVMLSLIVLVAAIIVNRFSAGSFLRTALLGLAAVLSLIGSLFGMIYPAVPPAPLPPVQPTYSIFTDLGLFIFVIGIIILAFPYIKKFAGKKEQNIPENVRLLAKISTISGGLIALCSILITPGVIIPLKMISTLAMPQSLLQIAEGSLSPFTWLNLLTAAVSLALLAVQSSIYSKKF
ncbi:MAG: alkaline phosphatase family protein [Nitrososphaeria archaeon]